MASLFDLSTEQREIMEAIEKGELSHEDAKDTLEGAQGALEDKLINYCHVDRNLNQQLDTIQEEIRRLLVLERKKKNEISNLKKWMLVGMETANLKSLDLGIYKIRTREGVETVNILDKDKINDVYVTTKITMTPDKKAILKALKAGVEIDGVEKVRGDKSITII